MQNCQYLYLYSAVLVKNILALSISPPKSTSKKSILAIFSRSTKFSKNFQTLWGPSFEFQQWLREVKSLKDEYLSNISR